VLIYFLVYLNAVCRIHILNSGKQDNYYALCIEKDLIAGALLCFKRHPDIHRKELKKSGPILIMIAPLHAEV